MSAQTISRAPGQGRMFGIWLHSFFIIVCLGAFIIPFLYVISVSLTNEDALVRYGYQLIPKEIDFTAYLYVFSNPRALVDAYGVTIFQSVLGTVLGLILMAMTAYTLSRPTYFLRKQLAFLIFFTMIFNGGLIPTFILNTQYLHLGNSIWIYIVSPWLVQAFYIIILRSFFQELPPALAESAKVDGASETRIFLQIILPLSKPVLATIALLTLMERWNVWYTTLIYVNNSRLYTLQYLLQKILLDAQAIQNMIENVPPGQEKLLNSLVPNESLRYAMCVLAAGPMLFVFMFFQKYFAKGMTVGSVKG